MKVYSFKFLWLLLVVVSMGSMGCLKDDDYNNGTIQSQRNSGTSQNIIEIQLTATSTDNFLLTAFNATTTDTVFNLIPVVLASPNVATEDIKVTLTPNPTLVADYNTAHGTNYVVPAPSMYTIVNPGNVVTIPAGSRVGYLQVKFKPIDFLGNNYALGFSIASVDKANYRISGNLRNGIAGIAIKNKYDGVYEITGTLVDANGLYTGDYGDPAAPRVYQLATASSNQGLFFDESWAYPNYIVININTGGAANTGIRPLITFDPATDVITAAINSNNGAVLTVGAGSKFNAADRSIDFEWTLGRWHATEHWEFLRER